VVFPQANGIRQSISFSPTAWWSARANGEVRGTVL